MFTLGEKTAIALLQGILQRARLHPTPIDEDGDILTASLGEDAVADIAVNAIMRIITNINPVLHFVERVVV